MGRWIGQDMIRLPNLLHFGSLITLATKQMRQISTI